jgi:aspartate kinase
MVVLKFGGTSVADPAALSRLIDIVARHRDNEPVVVVSALGGVTDRLIGLAAHVRSGDCIGARATVEELRDRHITMAASIAAETVQQSLLRELVDEFGRLAEVVNALCVLREVSPRWLDTIAATGELCSSRIVAAALEASGIRSMWVDARQVMVTGEEFTQATPQASSTAARLGVEVRPAVAAGLVPVIGGYVGSTSAGVTTTLGRGGSDYSAAIVGAALDADEIQIWTDVDGMLTADPRLISGAQVVNHLSFAEASELAYFGAKVLHPSTIQPAMAKGIPVRILNSRNAGAPGTLITAVRPDDGRPVTAVASKRQVTVVDIASTRMLGAHGFLRQLFAVFERHGISVDVVTTSEVSVSVTVDDGRRLDRAIAEIETFADASREDGMAIVCAVGEGIGRTPLVLAQLITAVSDVPVRMLSQAADRRNITMVISDRDLPGVLDRIHSAFFATTGASA